MTIKLAYVTERDGLVFLVDKEGKELGQVVPVSAIDWLNGEGPFECPQERYFRGQPPRYWWRSVFREKLAKVDVSAAWVKVPQFIGIDPARPGAEQSVEVKYRIENGSVVIDALEGK